MTEAYQEGCDAFAIGVDSLDNPYNNLDGHDMPPDEYFQWLHGWWDSEEDNAS